MFSGLRKRFQSLYLRSMDHYYQIGIENWASEEELLDDYVDLDDIELIKAVALDIARKRFPEVEIPEKT